MTVFRMWRNLHISSEKKVLSFFLWICDLILHFIQPFCTNTVYIHRKERFILNQVSPNLPTKLPPREGLPLFCGVFRFHPTSGSLAVPVKEMLVCQKLRLMHNEIQCICQLKSSQ